MFNKIGNKLSNWKRRAKHKININKIKNFNTAVTELEKYSENINSQFVNITSGDLLQNSDDGIEFLFKLFKRGGLAT